MKRRNAFGATVLVAGTAATAFAGGSASSAQAIKLPSLSYFSTKFSATSNYIKSILSAFSGWVISCFY